jgi:hypothetical protein
MKISKWAIALLIWGLGFRLAIATFLQPGYDEAYYYVYTLYPNWSYFDHPPLVSLVTGFGIWLTGDVSQLSIRLGTVLLYTGTLFLLYLTSARLFATKVATLTLAIATAIPFYQVGFGILTLPDSPLMFFWSASLCMAAYEFFQEPATNYQPLAIDGEAPSQVQSHPFTYQPTYRLALLGLLVGLSVLGKYHGFLLGMGLVLFCLLSPSHRTVWRSSWTLAAIGLFLLAISPVMIWNFQHDWVSFRFQSARAVAFSGYRLGDLLVTFLVGVGYLFPTFGFPMWWVSLRTSLRLLKAGKYRIHRLELSPIQQKQLMILLISVPVFLGFTLMGGYRQILPSWHMPGFFTATLLLGQQMSLVQDQHPKRIRNWLWGSGVAIVLILTLALLHVTDGLVQKGGDRAIFGGFWAAKDDPSTQLLDIQQLRRGFTSSTLLSAEISKADFIFSNNFFLAGQVSMALSPLGHKPITAFDQDLRGFAFWESASQWLGKDALYVTSEEFQEPLQEPLSKYDGYFQSITKLADVPIIRAGEAVQVFHIYHCSKLLKLYPRPYGIN